MRKGLKTRGFLSGGYKKSRQSRDCGKWCCGVPMGDQSSLNLMAFLMAIEIVTKNVTKSVREKNQNGTSDKENFTDPQGTKKPLSEIDSGSGF